MGCRITEERLKELVWYDPDTGIFTWKAKRPHCRPGSLCGNPVGIKGYMAVMLDYKRYYFHQLAMLYMTGVFPSSDVDHVDRDVTNNRWSNLRLATRSENCQNKVVRPISKMGYVGIERRKSSGRYTATIKTKGKKKWLGTYDTPEQAQAAYIAAKAKYHPRATVVAGNGTAIRSE